MPTFLNPFKSSSHAPADLRLRWLHAIFENFERVQISSYEVDLQKKTPTIESVKYLLTKYKKIYLVIGADNLATLAKWTEYDALKELVTFIVCTRDNIEIPLEMLQIKIDVPISSTMLREHIEISKLIMPCAQEIQNYYTKEKNER